MVRIDAQYQHQDYVPSKEVTVMVDATKLTQELSGLLKEQSQALNDSTFLGMTEQEAREFDHRSAKIHELQKQLGQLNVLD